ncbi:Hypothetical predicted protein [Octopus vulgaris]|uniref:Uncharacterized protein n=1 Tax=Octopus vulgaris TaxID=6645 RepID=A0AA36B7Z0_OCTVU|nr:Hypothetical predicted protein [Octopus vulgaris]
MRQEVPKIGVDVRIQRSLHVEAPAWMVCDVISAVVISDGAAGGSIGGGALSGGENVCCGSCGDRESEKF